MKKKSNLNRRSCTRVWAAGLLGCVMVREQQCALETHNAGDCRCGSGTVWCGAVRDGAPGSDSWCFRSPFFLSDVTASGMLSLKATGGATQLPRARPLPFEILSVITDLSSLFLWQGNHGDWGWWAY